MGRVPTRPGQAITDRVVELYGGVASERLRFLLAEATKAAHDFARSVDLTPDELLAATAFLTRVGQASDEVRQEFILLSDTSGLTMVVDEIAQQASARSTPSSALGPFFRADAPTLLPGDVLGRPGVDGSPLHVELSVSDPEGTPIGGATLEVWLAAANGLYENQDGDQPEMNLRGRIVSDGDGKVNFWTVRPSSYPIPHDGPVGDLLRLAGRHPYRPAHLHIAAAAGGFLPLTTALYFANDPYLDSDAVHAVKPELVVAPEAWIGEMPSACGPGAAEHLRYALVLAPKDER